MKDTIIVGHGPSLIGLGKGPYIDSFKNIIRFPQVSTYSTKRGFVLDNKEDLGEISHYIMSLYKSMHHRKILPERETWLVHNFGDRDWPDIPIKFMLPKWKKFNIIFFNDIMYYWYNKFLELKPHFFKWSKGILAVIAAAYHLRPKELCLAGFDNIRNKVDFSGHDCKHEYQLLEQIIEKYNIKLRWIPK